MFWGFRAIWIWVIPFILSVCFYGISITDLVFFSTFCKTFALGVCAVF